MDNDSDKPNWFTILIIVFFIGLITSFIYRPDKYEGQTAKEWFNEYDYCVDQVVEANSKIEEAKNHEDGTYEEIKNALYELEPVEGC